MLVLLERVTSSLRATVGQSKLSKLKNLLKQEGDPYLALLSYQSTPLKCRFSPSELLESWGWMHHNVRKLETLFPGQNVYVTVRGEVSHVDICPVKRTCIYTCRIYACSLLTLHTLFTRVTLYNRQCHTKGWSQHAICILICPYKNLICSLVPRLPPFLWSPSVWAVQFAPRFSCESLAPRDY